MLRVGLLMTNDIFNVRGISTIDYEVVMIIEMLRFIQTFRQFVFCLYHKYTFTLLFSKLNQAVEGKKQSFMSQTVFRLLKYIISHITKVC